MLHIHKSGCYSRNTQDIKVYRLKTTSKFERIFIKEWAFLGWPSLLAMRGFNCCILFLSSLPFVILIALSARHVSSGLLYSDHPFYGSGFSFPPSSGVRELFCPPVAYSSCLLFRYSISLFVSLLGASGLGTRAYITCRACRVGFVSTALARSRAISFMYFGVTGLHGHLSGHSAKVQRNPTLVPTNARRPVRFSSSQLLPRTYVLTCVWRWCTHCRMLLYLHNPHHTLRAPFTLLFFSRRGRNTTGGVGLRGYVCLAL